VKLTITIDAEGSTHNLQHLLESVRSATKMHHPEFLWKCVLLQFWDAPQLEEQEPREPLWDPPQLEEQEPREPRSRA